MTFRDVGCCGLPLQRLLRLIEQPRILDGDDGLIGEGLQQTDCLSQSKESFASRRVMPIVPIAIPLQQHRHHQHAAPADRSRKLLDVLREGIGSVNIR